LGKISVDSSKPEQQLEEEEEEEKGWPKPQQQVPPVEVAYTMLDMHSSNQKGHCWGQLNVCTHICIA
jgi:hypothetical protein